MIGPPRWLRRIFGCAIGVALILVLQSHFLSVRICELTEWPEDATVIARDSRWAYGYSRGPHGAVLFKAPETSAPNRDPDSEPEVRAYESETKGYMIRELEGVPNLAILEGVFYASWFALLAWVLPGLVRPLIGSSASRWRRAAVIGFAAGLAALYFLLPRAVACYGCSAYSTYAGPYWMSMSGGYLAPTFWPGETVSYRPVLEILFLPLRPLARHLPCQWVVLPLLTFASAGMLAYFAAVATDAGRAMLARAHQYAARVSSSSAPASRDPRP